MVGLRCFSIFSSLIFTFSKYFGKLTHSEPFPINTDATYIKKYIHKSSDVFTKEKVHIIPTNFIIIFLVTAFLKSSIPCKSQVMSMLFPIISNINIL